METKPVNYARVPLGGEPIRKSRRLVDFARALISAMAPGRRLVVDGMWGFPWNQLEQALLDAASERGIALSVHATASALRAPAALRSVFSEWLTDDPTFGRVCDASIDIYFDPARVAELSGLFDAAESRTALVGPGALFIAGQSRRLGPGDLGVYCDLPREEIIRKHDLEGLGNFGIGSAPPHSAYKAAYYVEWPVLERHKLDSWKEFELYCSLSDGTFSWTSRRHLEALVKDASRRPFRCKPMFMPGVWGGKRLLEAADIGRPMPNSAWDFEIVAPENAITIGSPGQEIAIGFHLFMHLESASILGPEPSRCFGTYFPIRFNYLDTMGGSNLSCQVHPHAGYIRDRFNEPMAQHESYYVVECKPGAKVYLGFLESATRQSFRDAVARAENEKIPFAIDDYVKGWPSEEGGYFIIPAGTVHCSGKDNLVLEISATPYWYTFKIYDYLRPDLNGEPRPIHSARAFDVLDFSRKESWVERKLIGRPRLVRREEGGEEYVLGSMEEVFFAVNRLHVRTSLDDDTNGRFHILALVKGDSAFLVSAEDPSVRIRISYLETFVVPASFGAYRVEACGGPCQIVKAYVKL